MLNPTFLKLFSEISSILDSGIKFEPVKAKEAILSFSEGDEQRAMLMGLKRFTKYQNMPNIALLRKTVAEKVIEKNSYPF